MTTPPLLHNLQLTRSLLFCHTVELQIQWVTDKVKNWNLFKELFANTYRRAHPFNLPAHPYNLTISDKLWALEKNKGHFVILELKSGIIKWPHRMNLKGCVDRGFQYCGTLKKAFRIKTPSEIDTSTTSGHPLSFLFNEPLEFH